MPYSIPWDEAEPIGATTPAANIDTEIQETKIALRERLEQVIPDFGNDAVDPKTLALSILLVTLDSPITTTSVVGQDLALTEKFNNGDFTVAGTTITFNRAGQYLSILTGEAQINSPAGGESVDMIVLGSATINSHFIGTQATAQGGQGNHAASLAGMNLIIAAIGETAKVQVSLLNSTGANNITLSDVRMFIFRLGD